MIIWIQVAPGILRPTTEYPTDETVIEFNDIWGIPPDELAAAITDAMVEDWEQGGGCETG